MSVPNGNGIEGLGVQSRELVWGAGAFFCFKILAAEVV